MAGSTARTMPESRLRAETDKLRTFVWSARQSAAATTRRAAFVQHLQSDAIRRLKTLQLLQEEE
jgi:hypothetical protein